MKIEEGFTFRQTDEIKKIINSELLYFKKYIAINEITKDLECTKKECECIKKECEQVKKNIEYLVKRMDVLEHKLDILLNKKQSKNLWKRLFYKK
jgi:predicted transcriptional regulator